jgi:hypothetical protein
MSTITLDMLTSAIREAHPTMPAADAGAMLANVIRKLDDATPTPTPTIAKAPARKPKAKKADKRTDAKVWEMTPEMRRERYVGAFWAGLASKAQKRRIVEFAKENGYEAFSATDLRDMSAVDAAEWYVWMNADLRGIAYVAA